MTELVILRAADEAALVAEMGRVVGFLDRVPDVPLADVAYTCSLMKGPAAIAIVSETVVDLRARLSSARARLESGPVRRLRDKSGTYYFREHLLGREDGGKLAFMYPGAMSFYPDMLRDIAIAYPECRGAFDELEEALAQDGSAFTPSSFIFPPAPHYRHDADVFSSGAYAQALVATYAACGALTRLMRRMGIVPNGVVGFGGGDLAATIRSGAAGANPTRPERIRMIRDIYKIVDKAVDHAGLPETAMVTLLLRREGEADEILSSFPDGMVTLALDFSPRQKTYAIAKEFEETAMKAFAAAGIRAMTLALNRPFNTPLCEKLVPAIRKFADAWIRQEPICDVYSCATAELLPTRLRKAREDVASRWTKPVRFGDTVRRMYEDGYRVFLEVGPRGLMASAVDDALRGEDHASISLNSIHRRGIPQVQHALAQLAALGAEFDISTECLQRGARKVDFDSAFVPGERRETEMRLSRAFPRMTLLSDGTPLHGMTAPTEARGRGGRAVARAAAVAARERRGRQFDSGAMNPLVSDADIIDSTPGVSLELRKTFRLSDAPFIGDFALGNSQLSYAYPNLKGLVLLPIPVAAEVMAEVASMIVPNRDLFAIEELVNRRMVSFENGELTLFMRAERVASGNPELAAVKVQLRDDKPDSAYTWPIMEATFVMAKKLEPMPVRSMPHTRPRSVHWSGRDIYPSRICYGRRLRGISFVETWSESGLDYEVEVPPLAGNVVFTRFPIWLVNPLLLEAVVSAFALWRNRDRFSFAFRMRRLELHAPLPNEGARVKCYLRLTGVTPKSHLCDITVSDGKGGVLMTIAGWEEIVKYIRPEYHELIMQPATSFVTKPLSAETLGNPPADVAAAYVTDVPYADFERDDEIWLRTFSCIVLGEKERGQFKAMPGSAARRTEWLFGRIAAKEAVRRYLKDFHQARWSDADVEIFADDAGKPYAIGAWNDYLQLKLDIAIAHTAQFVIALAASNARIGVDVESVSRDLSGEFTAGVFTPEELELAAQAVNPSQSIIRFWCAKEAVSKALGTGIRYSPKELIVSGYQADASVLTVRLTGAWEDAFRNLKGRDLPVTFRTMNDHALAFCFIPRTLFNED